MRWILFLALFMAVSSGPEVKVYRGTSTYSKDILATIRDGKVYAGNSQYTFDIRFTFDGPLLLEEFVAVWFAVMYVW